MDSICKSFPICINKIRRWFTNPRIYILGVLLIILVLNHVGPITAFSKSVGYRVTPWVFPFLSNFFFTQIGMMLGIVFLFCDAPFIDEGQPYLLIRSGRIQWGVGQVLYIMLGTAIYFLFITFISILVLSPNMFVSDGWGKVLSTLAQSNAGQEIKILPVSYKIQTLYSPMKAFSLSLLLEWCAGTILGLIIFITNIHLNRAMGAIIASAVTFLDILISNALPNYMYHFSPISMARLTVLDPTGLAWNPSNLYAYIFFAASIIVLSIFAVLSVRKRDIQVLPPV